MKLELDDVVLELPDSYQDVTLQDKLSLVKLAVRKTGDVLGDTMLLVEILKVLFAIGYRKEKRKLSLKKYWKGLVFSPEQLAVLESELQWVYEKPKESFDAFTHDGVLYHVVAERFKYTSAAEFTEGLMDFIDLTPSIPQSGGSAYDGDALDRLIANFCRAERSDLESFRASDEWNGDIRVPYNRHRAEELAVKLAGLDPGIKILFLWHYDKLINAFFEEYEELFGGGGQKRYEDGRGYVMVLKNAAKGHYLGDFKAVQNEDVNVVYSLLLDDHFDSLEAKR